MSNVVKFKINGLSSALNNVYTRVTDLSRVELFEGETLVSDAIGNVELNIGASGSIGQGVIVYGDNYSAGNESIFKSFSGYGLIEAEAPNSVYTFVYGQSLSIGDGGTPNTKDTPELADISIAKLFAGVDTNGPGGGGAVYAPADVATLKPFAEYDTYQSHAWGYYNKLQSYGAARDGIYSSVGVGAQSVADLTASPIYDNVPIVIEAAGNLLGTEKRSAVIQYNQGEADTTIGTAPAVWKASVKSLLKDDAEVQIKTQLGVSKVDTYLVQLSKGNTHPSGGYSIANAQLEYALENDDTHLAVAPWFINRKYGRTDYQPHFTADGYTQLGEYLAKAENQVNNGVVKFTPPRPLSFTVLPDFRTVEIEYYSPSGALTLGAAATETDIPLADGAGFGFGELSNLDIINAATSYNIVGSKVTLVSPVLIESGVNLTAGRTGPNWDKNTAYKLPCINLRNTGTEVSTLGDTMHDWAAQFTEVLSHSQGAFDRDIDNIWSVNVDPAFALPATSAEAASVTSYTGVVTYTKMQPNATYQVDFDLTVVSGSFRLTVGSSTDGLRESFTSSGVYSRTVSTISGKALKADALGVDHNMTLNSITVVRIS